jgi:hypothetical protein
MGQMRTAYKISVGKPEAKRHFGYVSVGGNDNIKKDLREI